MPQTLTALGPEFQVNINSGGNNGISGAQDLPDVAVLPDGRFVVAYQSGLLWQRHRYRSDRRALQCGWDHFPSLSRHLTTRAPFRKCRRSPRAWMAVSWVVFQNDPPRQQHRRRQRPEHRLCSGLGRRRSRVAYCGRRLQRRGGHDALQVPATATLSTGRQVVAFERVWTANVDHDVFLNVVNAAGTATQFSIASPLNVSADASWQANPAVAAIGDQAIVVYEDGTGTTTASANIRARIFDGTSNTLDAAFTVADHTARLRTADVVAIDQSAVGDRDAVGIAGEVPSRPFALSVSSRPGRECQMISKS